MKSNGKQVQQTQDEANDLILCGALEYNSNTRETLMRTAIAQTVLTQSMLVAERRIEDK